MADQVAAEAVPHRLHYRGWIAALAVALFGSFEWRSQRRRRALPGLL